MNSHRRCFFLVLPLTAAMLTMVACPTPALAVVNPGGGAREQCDKLLSVSPESSAKQTCESEKDPNGFSSGGARTDVHNGTFPDSSATYRADFHYDYDWDVVTGNGFSQFAAAGRIERIDGPEMRIEQHSRITLDFQTDEAFQLTFHPLFTTAGQYAEIKLLDALGGELTTRDLDLALPALDRLARSGRRRLRPRRCSGLAGERQPSAGRFGLRPRRRRRQLEQHCSSRAGVDTVVCCRSKFLGSRTQATIATCSPGLRSATLVGALAPQHFPWIQRRLRRPRRQRHFLH